MSDGRETKRSYKHFTTILESINKLNMYKDTYIKTRN